MPVTCAPTLRPWMRPVLLASSGYSLIWGIWMMVAPTAAFSLAALPAPNYPELWQAGGLMLVVLAAGYAAASIHPVKYWPVVLMGFLAKAGSLAGFTLMTISRDLPWSLYAIAIVNDALWLAPFAMILYAAYEQMVGQKRITSPEVQRMALRSKTQFGMSLDELSRLSPVLLVFLRHAGCTFCREALADLAHQRQALSEAGTRVVLIHMGSEADMVEVLERYGLMDIDRVCDARQAVYRAFGLRRGRLVDLFGPRVWWRGFKAGILSGHGLGALAGDGFQMPGVFLIYHGEVLRSFVHRSASDRPNYLALASEQAYPQTGTVA